MGIRIFGVCDERLCLLCVLFFPFGSYLCFFSALVIRRAPVRLFFGRATAVLLLLLLLLRFLGIPLIVQWLVDFDAYAKYHTYFYLSM